MISKYEHLKLYINSFTVKSDVLNIEYYETIDDFGIRLVAEDDTIINPLHSCEEFEDILIDVKQTIYVSLNTRNSANQLQFSVSSQNTMTGIVTHLVEIYKNCWMKVNKKTDFNRTKISKAFRKAAYGNRDYFEDRVISTYFAHYSDGLRYRQLIHPKQPITDLEKKIAKQFEEICGVKAKK